MASERWTYIGRRDLGKGGLGHCFLDPEGNELAYTGKAMRAQAIGGHYDVDVNRDGGSVRARIIRFVGDSEDSRKPEWEADDRTSYAADELRKAEQRMRREGREQFGNLTLDELHEMYLKQPPGRAAAFLAQVLRYLGAS
jgi:hypothetical protein